MNPNGTFTYTPIPGFHGTVTFTYSVTDEAGNIGTGIGKVEIIDAARVCWGGPTQREN